MSIQYCHDCGKNIDTDFDAEHFEEHDDGSDDTGREQEDREQELWGVDANEHELSSIESSMGY